MRLGTLEQSLDLAEAEAPAGERSSTSASGWHVTIMQGPRARQPPRATRLRPVPASRRHRRRALVPAHDQNRVGASESIAGRRRRVWSGVNGLGTKLGGTQRRCNRPARSHRTRHDRDVAVAGFAFSRTITCQPSSSPRRSLSRQITAGDSASARPRPTAPEGACLNRQPVGAGIRECHGELGDDPITSTRAPLLASVRATRRSGTRTRTHCPRLGALEADPAAMRRDDLRQSASPSPVPPISRVSDESTRKNLVNTRAC